MTNSNLKRTPQYFNALEGVRSGRIKRYNLENEAPDKSDVYIEPSTLEEGEPTSYGPDDTQLTETVTAKEAKDMQKELEDGMDDDPQYVNTTLNSDRRTQRGRVTHKRNSRNPRDNNRLISKQYSSSASKISNQNKENYMTRQRQRPSTQEFNHGNGQGVRNYPDNAQNRMHSRRNPINRNYTKREILESQREGNERIRRYNDDSRYSQNDENEYNNDKIRMQMYNRNRIPGNNIPIDRNNVARSRKFSGLESREAKSRRYSAHKPITFIPNEVNTRKYAENPTLKNFDNSELADLKYQLGYEKGLNKGLNQLVSKYSEILDSDSVDSKVLNGSEIEKNKLHMRDNDYFYTKRNPIKRNYMDEIMDENVDMMEGEYDADGNFMSYEDEGEMEVYSNRSRGKRNHHTKSYSNNGRNDRNDRNDRNEEIHTKSYSNNGGNEGSKFANSVDELLQ